MPMESFWYSSVLTPSLLTFIDGERVGVSGNSIGLESTKCVAIKKSIMKTAVPAAILRRISGIRPFTLGDAVDAG